MDVLLAKARLALDQKAMKPQVNDDHAFSLVRCLLYTSLRKDLFRHVFSLSQAEYGSVGTNSLITRLTSDVNQVRCV